MMIARRPYPNAPITEAIIDIRVRLSESVQLEDLEGLHNAIRNRYPKKASRNLTQGRIEVGKQISASATREQIGYLFTSEDGKQIVQTRLDGFTISRLAPYESWEPFQAEASRLWKIYREATKPEELTRLAVRYINRIDIPYPFGDLNEYLRTYPQVSTELPQHALAGLFMQLKIPQPDIQAEMLLTEAIIDPELVNIVRIVLDIDVFREANVPQDDEDIWNLFEVLRVRKNKVFEGCITDKTRELFKSCQ